MGRDKKNKPKEPGFSNPAHPQCRVGKPGLLWLEFLFLFIALPLALWQVAVRATTIRMPVLPCLWLAAAVATVWLVRKRGWTRRTFFGFDGVTRGDWLKLGLRVLAGALLLGAALWWLMPFALLKFPLERTRFWVIVVLAYPLVSVVPQGIVYRALFFERYAPLFGRFACVVAPVVFSLGHIVFNNPHALVLTLIGGVIFTWQYRKTGSLMFANTEHALLGNLAFSVGWGMYLHGGTMALRGGN